MKKIGEILGVIGLLTAAWLIMAVAAAALGAGIVAGGLAVAALTSAL